jgi:hypothetical protein
VLPDRIESDTDAGALLAFQDEADVPALVESSEAIQPLGQPG